PWRVVVWAVPAEAGDRYGDGVGVLAEHFDVVGRVGRGALMEAAGRIEQARHTVETDGGTEKGRKIKGSTHAISSSEQHGLAELPPPGDCGRTRSAASVHAL